MTSAADAFGQAEHRLALIIPTKDHPDDLRRLLANLARQTVLPDEVIVVDGSATSVEAIVRECSALPLRYARVVPPGLARQQNVGIGLVSSWSTLVAFLDDDMELEPAALEAMLAFWRQAPADVGGAAFNLVNNTQPPRWMWLKAPFGMDSAHRGVVLSSGYQSKIGAVEQTQFVEWLYGGAVTWRREIFEAGRFDEWFGGAGHLYEVEFSFWVGQRYRLAVVAEARVRELALHRRWQEVPMGRAQILNRWYFVQTHRGERGLSLRRCALALACQILVNVGRGLTGEWRCFARAWGNARGILALVQAAPSRRRLAPADMGRSWKPDPA